MSFEHASQALACGAPDARVRTMTANTLFIGGLDVRFPLSAACANRALTGPSACVTNCLLEGEWTDQNLRCSSLGWSWSCFSVSCSHAGSVRLTRGRTNDLIEQIRLNAVARPIAARGDRASESCDPGGFVHAQRSRGSIAGIRAGAGAFGSREIDMQRKRTPASFVHWAVVFLLMALVLPASLHAQETRGRITGRVTDTTKATVPGASVTVTDVSRGTTVSATTNEQGLFQVNYLLPGTYTVTVELTGFKKHIQGNVQLQISETRNLPVVLGVGGIQEAVSVSAEAVTLNTTDGSMGLVVDQQRLASLPLIHGDPYKIMGLATGLAHTGDPRLDRPFEPTHIIGFAFDGTRGNRSDLLIDGLPSTATANSGANANNAFTVIATYVPQSDLVQEFKVQTATFDSQFGNTEGGVTSMAIKSGTNRLHGSAYYFAEPSSLGANDVFGNARGQSKIESNSNRPGFTIMGPVLKDRTFFTFGYERITDQRPRFDIAGTSWVPTEAMRNGDFSAYSSQIKIYDPLTRTSIGGGQYTGTQFSNNVIPANRIDPVATAILSYYSLPKTPGTNPATGPAGNISDATLAEQTKAYNTVTGRVDQKISDKNRMFGRFSWYQRDSHYDNYLGSAASGTLFQFISWQGVVDDVHVFNPTTVLNVRFGYNRFDRNSDMELPEAIGFDLTKIGFPTQYNTLISDVNRRFPRLDFTSGDMVSVAYGNDFLSLIHISEPTRLGMISYAV